MKKGRTLTAATLLAASLLVTVFTVSAGARLGRVAACSTANVLSGSNFEIDADANLKVDGGGTCIDWLADGSGSAMRSGVLTKNDVPSGSGDDAFGQGTKEDDPNPTIVTGSIPPQKSDLKVFGVYTELGASGKFLELFWSRINSPQGTTNMDFELNQKFCDPSATPTNCADNGSAVPAPETPLRTVGDKLITYDLSKGGTVPTISIRTWDGSAWGAPTVISGPGGTAIGSVNTSTIDATDAGGIGGQDPFTFGEAAIAFSALFPPGAPCGTFGSAYLKSRSSDAFTAEIKDFIAPEPVTITNCTEIKTTLSATSITVGGSVHDSASLTGATSDAGGTVSYAVYTNNTCTALAVAGTDINAQPGSVTVTNGSVPDSASVQFLKTGTYYWQAVYSGDLNNATSTSACSSETLVVNKASPTISTTPNPSSGDVGVTLNDSATLSIGFNPTGNIVFRLFGPNDPTCTGSPVYTETVTVSGNGSYSTTTGYPTALAGTYHWTASYSGDGNNNAIASNCADEAVAVGVRVPSISTTPNPSSATIGDVLNDSASLSGGFQPTGNIVFSLWGPGNPTCDPNVAAAIFSETVSVSGNGNYSTTTGYTTTEVGTYHWTASYSGDANNGPAASNCADEAVVVGKAPSNIATAQQLFPQDSATVSATAGGQPTGTVTFMLFPPLDPTCIGLPVYQETVALSSGSASTSNSTFSVSAATADTYNWEVSYSGDAKHEGATSSCGTENFTLTIVNG